MDTRELGPIAPQRGRAALPARAAVLVAVAERLGWRLAPAAPGTAGSGPDRALNLDLVSLTPADRQPDHRLDRVVGLVNLAGSFGWGLVHVASDAGAVPGSVGVVLAVTMPNRLPGSGRDGSSRSGAARGRRSGLDARVVERVVAERAAGSTLRAIAGGLDADGIATGQDGRRWYASTVRAVLDAARRTGDRS